jgi:predicted DNA-binding transcriptional regulator YafY
MITGLDVYDEPARPMREIEELKDIGHGRTIADYLRESVNMWEGETTSVTLRAGNELRHDVMRKFGRNIMIRDEGKEEFIAHLNVANSDGFFYWLASYGPYITLEGPENMRDGYVEFLRKSLEKYKDE